MSIRLTAFILIIWNFAFAQNVELGPDTLICHGQTVQLNPLVNYQIFPDSLVITYDATQGVTQLAGANKVYMHSAYEAVPFGGPVVPWVGNWGLDDGLGLMTEIANDVWQITIQLNSYYGIAQGSPINGLFMVFRNEDGTLTGKDNNNNDIFLGLSGNPSSPFSGVTAQYLTDAIVTVIWNTGQTSETLIADSSGTYMVMVTDTASNVYYDTVVVTVIHPVASLGADQVICPGTTAFLNPGAGFSSYLWSTNDTTPTLTVIQPGNYWVQVSLSGCTAGDTISVTSSANNVNAISLGNDTALCGASAFVLNPGITLSVAGDSLTITYDATMGVTELIGASKVYMHAGYQLIPFGPVTGWVGNWGSDDGLGKMDSLGNNIWQITINMHNYFGLLPGTAINAVVMVFRNENGTLTGKDDNNNDIYLVVNPLPPFSSFSGVTATYDQNPYQSALWSDGSTGATLTVNTDGIYFVTIQTNVGCTLRDTIVISYGTIPFVDAGSSQSICLGDQLVLDAGPGFVSYYWSTGSTASSITVNTSGTYTIVVTNSDGCTGIDVINIAVTPLPVASFTFQVNPGGIVNYSSTSTDAVSYAWDLDGNGTTDATNPNTFYTYLVPGTYQVRLIVTNACGSDTIIIPVNTVSSVNNQNSGQLQINIFPSPANEYFMIEPVSLSEDITDIRLMDVMGKVHWSETAAEKGRIKVGTNNLSTGNYILLLRTQSEVFKKTIQIVHH